MNELFLILILPLEASTVLSIWFELWFPMLWLPWLYAVILENIVRCSLLYPWDSSCREKEGCHRYILPKSLQPQGSVITSLILLPLPTHECWHAFLNLRFLCSVYQHHTLQKVSTWEEVARLRKRRKWFLEHHTLQWPSASHHVDLPTLPCSWV